jgi:hypothetical protein
MLSAGYCYQKVRDPNDHNKRLPLYECDEGLQFIVSL